MKNKILTKDALIGLAVGDAFGVPLEFFTRKKVREADLKDMIRTWLGIFIPAGAWSDDTSMTIAEMDSIIQNNGKIDYEDIMNNFIEWWYHGKYTSFGKAFGLGGIVGESLERFQSGYPALECGGTDIMDNGNGSLMRIMPFSLFAIKMQMTEQETADFIGKASSVTHAHDISKMGCFIYTEFLRNLSVSFNAKISYQQILKIDYHKYFSTEAINAYQKILNPDFLNISDAEISEHNGYIVATLESVLYSILTTSDYESALLKAISMGYDTDTIGGITGSIAGILYGYETIPARWLDELQKKSELEILAEKFDLLLKGSNYDKCK